MTIPYKDLTFSVMTHEMNHQVPKAVALIKPLSVGSSRRSMIREKRVSLIEPQATAETPLMSHPKIATIVTIPSNACHLKVKPSWLA